MNVQLLLLDCQQDVVSEGCSRKCTVVSLLLVRMCVVREGLPGAVFSTNGPWHTSVLSHNARCAVTNCRDEEDDE